MLPTSRHFIASAAALVGIAAGCVHYSPKPIAPKQNFDQLESRTLTNASLRAFMETNAADIVREWPRRSWDLATLTLAAFYYHPALDVARAQVGVTDAGIVTAGGRPNPTVSLSPEYTFSSDAGMSPWLMGVSFDIPIETAGKRGLRIARAKQLSEAARIQVAETGWKVRSGVRAALLENRLVARDVELLQTEITARSNVVHLMERRFVAGEISRTELDVAKTELVRVRVASLAAEGRINEARIALATALGLSPTAVQDARLEWADLEKLPTSDTISADTVQTAGLMNRLDVRRALAEYAAAEKALQLEIAKQYPDVHVQPGYQFDQGEHQFAFGLSVELPVLNQNLGPIAEAKARREKAAADFLALQAQVIGELHKARAQYGAALAELREIETSLSELQTRAERLTERAVELGEADRLALASVRLQRIVISKNRLDALRRAQTALGALEDAVQRPLSKTNGMRESELLLQRIER